MRPAEIGRLRIPARVWLFATVTLTLAPHAMAQPMWLTLFCALLLCWQAYELHAGHLKHARRLVILLLAISAGIAVKLHFGQFFGKDPGVALLAVLLCLKQFELNADRDIRAAVLLSFFLQLALFLNDQTLPVAGLALTGSLIATVTLLSLQDVRADAGQQLRTGGLLLLQALPFLIVLFIAFPRIEGPLWGLPNDAFRATTGLSDTMEPGSISDLSESSAIALRAAFDGPPPPARMRYWRGPVLSQFDGRSWRAVAAGSAAAPRYVTTGPAFDYVLTLEPHNRPWLLALDVTAAGVEHARYANDFQLLATTPVRERRRLALRAYPETPLGPVEPAGLLRMNLQLPAGFNPRTSELVDELTRTASDPESKVARVLDYFRGGSFIYTLRPPLLGRHSVDEFLFETRRGFCEHFASAFVVMMRAAGVPARVITGYQGGEVNPVDGVMVVRQSDAHAWAEVWHEGRGWIRIDPTAAANPTRIDGGLAAALPEDAFRPLMMWPALEWLRDMRHQWEALSNAWNEWVLGYNPERQRRLMERFGFEQPDWRTLGALLGGATTILLLGLFGWAMLKERSADPLDRAWAVFCAKLARHALPRHPWEGPLDYAQRLTQALPRHASRIRHITGVYANLRYGPPNPKHVQLARKLLQEIKRLDLK